MSSPYFGDNVDFAGRSIWELGCHPFNLVWPGAKVYGRDEDSYPHLPCFYLHGSLYFVGCQQDVIVWKCSCCDWWCEVLDQRIMEEHLINRCPQIDPDVRREYALLVRDQIIKHADRIFTATMSAKNNHVNSVSR